jgi:hypothetical protein
MGGFDSATWQALGLTVTLLGLVVTALVWRRRGPVSGLRALAWSLLPLAAGLTGVLRLAWDITDLVVNWAVHVVFSPVVWLCVLVAGVSATLFVVSGFLGRRRPAPSTRSKKSQQAARPQQTGAALPAKGPRPAAVPETTADDDLADIEELLRKHGIR